MGFADWIGERARRVLLRLLPRELRDAWGAEMESTLRQERLRVLEGNVSDVVRFWARESLGLVSTAVRARRPDAWTRRTAPAPQCPITERRRIGKLGMDSLTSDVLFAFRTLRRRRATMGLAVLTLALGIGASTAMFSVVDSVLLRALAFPDPDAIVSLYPTNPALRGHPTLRASADRGTFSLPEFFWLAEHQTTFDAVGAYIAWGGPTLAGDGETPEQLSWVRATPGLLEALRVSPVRGRLFGVEDDPRRGARSVMLTERFWATRFASDPDVVGRVIRMNGVSYTVIGVLPREVAEAAAPADVWVLMTGTSTDGNWGVHSVTGALGRLAQGATIESARSELSRLMAEVPAGNRHEHGASVFPQLHDRTRRVRPALLALIAAAIVLLAVGCGNVAALFLAEGIDREPEIALRRALGACRRRLARLFLTESLVLTTMGAAAGVAVALGLTRLFLWVAPPGVPRLEHAAVDGHALIFAIGIATLCGVAFGMIPALYLSRPEGAAGVRSSPRVATGRGTLQATVVGGELALATLLLVSAALFGRTLFALNRVDLGVDPVGLYEVRIAPQYQRFRDLEDRHERTRAVDDYFQQIVDAVSAISGVESVAVTDNVPLTSDRGNNDVVPEGWDQEAENETLLAERRLVSANFFETARIRMVEGRGFRPADNHPNARAVMVISEGLARRVWPYESALGKRIVFWGREPATVVGVAVDLRDEDLTSATSYAFYTPARQLGEQVGALLVRIEREWGDPSSVLAELRPRIWSVDQDVPVTRIASFDQLLSDAVGEQRYRARLMISFALLAATFALLGVYGATGRFVARRKREMGIRTALGAERRHVVSLVLRQGLRLAAFGSIAGLTVSAATTRWLADLLFGVGPLDPASLVLIVALVTTASVAPSLPPAWRAGRIPPSDALRIE